MASLAGNGRLLYADTEKAPPYIATLAPSPELLAQVRERFQTVEPEFRAVTGYGFDGLTESEASSSSARAPMP
jgi:hypothetical protein